MADILALRDALADAARTGTGVRCYKGNRDQVEPPCFVVGLPQRIEYDMAFARGADVHTFGVRFVVGRTDEVVAEERLAAALDGEGDSSLKAALESDQSLGGVADTVTVTAAGQLGVYAYGEVDYLGVEFTVDVIA